MEEVLGDRCIDVVMEKSGNKVITRKVESFDTDPLLIKTKELLIKANLSQVWCSLCSVVTEKNIYRDWNEYITITTLTTLYTLTPLTTPSTLNNTNYTKDIKQDLFKKIYDTGIDGRSLELTFPLLLIAAEMNMLDEAIKIFSKKIKDKREEDVMESKDVLLYSFISKQTPTELYKVKELTNLFRQQIELDIKEDDWLNARWMGRALKRLNLIIDKRRMGEGVEVTLNIEKAKEKIKMFQ
jgi:hypothetical protein